MHLSTTEESLCTGDNDDAYKPVSKEGATDNNLEAEEEMPTADIVVKEQYFEQQEEEELDYEDHALLRSVNKLLRKVNKLSGSTRMRKPLLQRLKNQPFRNGWEIPSTNEPALILTQVKPRASWSRSWGSRVPKVDTGPVKVVVTLVANAVIDSTPY